MKDIFLKWGIAFAGILMASSSWALPSICSSSSAHKIHRPLSSKDPQKGSFDYYFGLSPREDSQAPLVIFIPGGPGQTSMSMPLALPPEFAVVRTDPRGVGCNNSAQLRPEDLSSEEIARDVLAIVRTLKPQKYILYGTSYGTVVATMAAALTIEEGVPSPAAVVLEGTMARVYQPDEYLKGYLANWKSLKKKLSPAILQQLQGPQFPFGYTSEEWAAWVGSLLLYGEMPAGDYASGALAALDPGASTNEREFLKKQMKRLRQAADPAKTVLFKELICRELVPDIRDETYDFDFVNGDLVATNKRFCEGVPLSRPYDSARYQVRAPIYYFSGGQDPATPLSQVRYHFNNQFGSKTWISVKGAGHAPLTASLMDCSKDIWKALIESPKNLNFSQCHLKDQVKVESIDMPDPVLSGQLGRMFLKMRSLYEEVVRQAGGLLSLEVNWQSKYQVGAAYRNSFPEFRIVVDAGILKTPGNTSDMVAITLCHEMGHLMGGEPLRGAPMEWNGPLAPNGQSVMSAEGEADYYATAVCFRRLVAGENHQAALRGKNIPQRIVQDCDKVWSSASSESFLCQRTALAALSFLNMVKEFPISLERKDPAVTPRTIRNSYPARQCRLDTLVAGALCRDSSLPLDFALQNRAEMTKCADTLGARPACWYNRAEHLNLSGQ